MAQRWTLPISWENLKLNLGGGFGKLYATGSEGLSLSVLLFMFGKLGSGSKEQIRGGNPL